MEILKWFEGKKTYIAAGILALTALLRFIEKDLPGGVEALAAALAAFGLRSALAAQDARDGPTS